MADLAATYEAHVRQIYGFFAYRVGSKEVAEDLTQLTFERALRAWERFDERKASPVTWLHAIARNILIDHLRADKTPSQAPLDDHAERFGEEEHPNLGIGPELERALTVLGDREREILALRFGGDLTGEEIARVTGLTLGNVQQILSRSLRRLRKELEPELR